MAYQTVRDLVLQKNFDGETIRFDLVKQPGIVMTALAQASNDGINHKYKKLLALPTGTVGGLDGGVTPTTQNDEFADIGMSFWQALEQEAAEVIDNMIGGAPKYFEGSLPDYEEAFWQDSAKSFIYGGNSTFGDVKFTDGFHQYAKRYGNVIQMGGTTGSTTSIFAVKWNRKRCSTIWNGESINTGQFLTSKALNGGAPLMAMANVTTQEQKLVYQALHKGYFGLFSGSTYDIAAMTQIEDAADDRPTSTLLNKLIDMVKGDPSDTILYCSRNGRRMVNALKDAKLQLNIQDKDFNILVDNFNGYRLVVDDNISDVETNVLD